MLSGTGRNPRARAAKGAGDFPRHLLPTAEDTGTGGAAPSHPPMPQGILLRAGELCGGVTAGSMRNWQNLFLGEGENDYDNQ